MLQDASVQDLPIREERVKASVKEVEKDPVAQRTVLRLEPAPILISDVNKGKGHVFEYGEDASARESFDLNKNPPKMMAAAIKANRSFHAYSDPLLIKDYVEEARESSFASIFSVPPTVFKPGASVPGLIGMARNRTAVKRRPDKTGRNVKALVISTEVKKPMFAQREGKQHVGNKRRAVDSQEEEMNTSTQAKCLKVIPNERSPKSQ
ncbi:PREDICTED: uncharacterized protein LOC106297485 [Brassica oleracea var. oleracea]|uniref:uncharacterized protein LOC106297485 n=1 Tax=Brassica oleracea var. oleracea TaxID=109376 RepID=UPI0006A708D2|nr:PREDICTED: uncharacterized protein LOC106297485 [Brassica oleracea var. oleracea]